MIQSIVRTVVGCLGLFILLNLVGTLNSSFDGNSWWIDLRPVPAWIGRTALLFSSVVMLAFAFRPDGTRLYRTIVTLTMVTLAVVTLANAVEYWRLMAASRLHAGWGVPFSVLVSGVLITGAVAAARGIQSRMNWFVVPCAVACVAILFPLAQMGFFGKTDYRRPATAAVVFGAKAYADGRASDALADRVRTGCELYLQGYVDQLIFSGGPGDGAISEPEAMKNLAVSLGVPESDVVLDEYGLNTAATADNTIDMAGRLLAVSHAYHLPRIKMAYQQRGVEVYTVPAKERYVLTAMPYMMAREVAAWWFYYAQGFV